MRAQDAEGVIHAIYLDDPPGKTLCGYPPMRSNGHRWLPSDPPGNPYLLRDDRRVTCRFCLKLMT